MEEVKIIYRNVAVVAWKEKAQMVRRKSFRV